MNQMRDLKDKGGSERLPCFFRSGLRLPYLCFLSFLVPLTVNLLIGISLAQEIKDTDERIVTGMGVIVDRNVVLAREEAISTASLKAIEEYLIGKLGSEGMANNLERLDEEILSRTKEWIRDYRIISELRTERHVKVLMKVRVNEAVLEQKLEKMGLSEIEGAPIAVLLLVSEKKEGFSPTYWWGDPSRQAPFTQTELSISRAFEDRGFRVISRSFFPPEESYDEGMLDLALANEEAARWGELLSAQTVVVGEASLYGESQASVFLRAIKVSDGAVIVQGYREGIVDRDRGDERSAIGLAVNNWVSDMTSHITEAFKPTQKIINQIIIEIKGLKSLREFLRFKEFLGKDFPEIRSVLERSLTKDLIKVSVEAKGDTKRLAKKILNHPKRPLSFEIHELSDQGFTVVMR